jgi:hypothetical protein
VPATFWGVLAGSFFTLSGVWLTNRNSARNLRIQLEHDRKTRATEREMAMRKDIYLAAAEAIAAGYYAVAKFSDFKIEGTELTAAFVEKAPALAKVNIIAGPTVLRAMIAAEGDLNAAFMRLHTERVPGIVAKRDHLLVSKRVEFHLGLQTRANEMLNEENLKGRQDQVRWQGIQANFDFASEQLKQDLPAQRQLEEKTQSEQLRLSELITHELGRLVASFVPAVSAVRRELDLSIDEAELRQIFLSVAERNRDGIAGFIGEMKTAVAEHDPSHRAPPA